MEKRKNLIEFTPKKSFKNLMILTLLLINLPLFAFKEDSKKLIIEKNIFIDDCSKDDIYKYEYNNICYISCPKGTQVSKNNTNLCEKKYQKENNVNATNKTYEYEINNSSTSLNSILNEAKLRKMQDSDTDDVIYELRHRIDKKEDSEMKSLLEGDLTEIKRTEKGINYQVITTNYQKNDNEKISSLNLGKCEQILKQHYNLSHEEPLIIFKFDYYESGLLVPITEYEVYDINGFKLSLGICKDIGIEISIPLLTEEDEESCVQLCDDNCVFLSYSSDTKKYNCKCEIKQSMTLVSNIQPQKWNKEGTFKKFCEIKNGRFNLNNEIIEDLKQEFINGNLNKIMPDVIAGNDIVIKDKDINVQITTTENQKNNNYNDLTSIDLGECEEKLRKYYSISYDTPLVIFKVDSYNEDSSTPIVDYEIYQFNEVTNKYDKKQLDYCKDNMIYIKIPTALSETKVDTYNSSSNDICSSYKSENGKDILLKNRKKKESNSLCESTCNFEGYSSDSKVIVCECEVKLGASETSIDKNKEIDSPPSYYESNESKDSISSIFQCTNYFFSKEGFQGNSGSYLLLSLIVLNIIIFVMFYQVRANELLKMELDKGLVMGHISNFNNVPINNNAYNYAINNGNNNSPISNDINNANGDSLKTKKKQSRANKRKNNQKNNRGKTNKKTETTPQVSFPPKKGKINKNNNDIRLDVDSSRKPDSNMEFRNVENQGNLQNINMPVLNNNINYNYNLQNNNQINNLNIISGDMQLIYFNDYELNNMEYKEAIYYDKRTYFQYYLSLIKTKQALYFTFILKSDYNPQYLKISIFILSFFFIFFVNALFIGDVSLINTSDGYVFVYLLPQLIYSVIFVCCLIGLIKYLFLPEKEIVKLKNIKDQERYNSKYNKVSNNIRCKFRIYFLVDFILLFFIWFYVGLFCAVYKNTQTYLIKNVFITLAFYLLYPFVFSFFPGFFRIPSLKSTRRNKQCFYKLSKVLAST